MERRQRVLVLFLVGLVGLGGVAGLFSGALRSCSAPVASDATAERAIGPAEAGRLASVRVTNHLAGTAPFKARLESGGEQTRLVGWIDWRARVVYATVWRGGEVSWLQAVPDAVALHAAAKVPADSLPPARPPAGGWDVRRFSLSGSDGQPLDTLFAVLFLSAAKRPDPADLIARSGRWLGRETVDGVATDILRAPPLVGFAASAVQAPGPRIDPTDRGGALTYWVDMRSGLRRLQATVGRGVVATVDLPRSEPLPPLVPLEILGGAVPDPRPVTTAEAALLAELRVRNRASGGGPVSLSLPDPAVRGTGWLDWRDPAVYLAVRDADGDSLLRADPAGTGTLESTVELVRPPIPVPRTGWTEIGWEERVQDGPSDLDRLLAEALTLAGRTPDDPRRLVHVARWLRTDKIGSVDVTIFEIPKATETAVPPGGAGLRYWVDRTGLLRRLEIRTADGAFGRLDITPGRVPSL